LPFAFFLCFIQKQNFVEFSELEKHFVNDSKNIKLHFWVIWVLGHSTSGLGGTLKSEEYHNGREIDI
jgi:hypothetical protein